ncbi:MAG: hypothetical protein LCH85_00160 [Chloroflexi bacterium]|nr:hypothetical protein [Chloroflexota bacterium]
MRNIRLETSSIENQATLSSALDRLMAYPGWYQRECEPWLDLVSYFDSQHSLQPHKTRKAGFEQFMIEIVGAESFWTKYPKLANLLIKWIADVNKRAMQRSGHAIIRLTLLP